MKLTRLIVPRKDTARVCFEQSLYAQITAYRHHIVVEFGTSRKTYKIRMQLVNGHDVWTKVTGVEFQSVIPCSARLSWGSDTTHNLNSVEVQERITRGKVLLNDAVEHEKKNGR
jgi:hypothetical protein